MKALLLATTLLVTLGNGVGAGPSQEWPDHNGWIVRLNNATHICILENEINDGAKDFGIAETLVAVHQNAGMGYDLQLSLFSESPDILNGQRAFVAIDGSLVGEVSIDERRTVGKLHAVRLDAGNESSRIWQAMRDGKTEARFYLRNHYLYFNLAGYREALNDFGNCMQMVAN